MDKKISRVICAGGCTLLAALTPGIVLAQDALDSGDTAWMLTSTALVLFMTIPGLSLFYAGMVRAKNALSVMMQCFAICCLMTIIWALYGYSLASAMTSEVSWAVWVRLSWPGSPLTR